MKVSDVAAALEEFVPLVWQEEYDNAGLTVGDPDAEITKVLIALDATEEVIDEAVAAGAGMVVSHHPAIFGAQKRLIGANHEQRIAAKALRCGVALYGCHTNLDATPTEGISHRLGRMFGLRETAVLEPSAIDPKVGIGIVGSLDEPMETIRFLRRVKSVLNIEVLRHSPIATQKVCRVAVCSGSGGSLIERAAMAGAELYLAGDFRYHDYLALDGRMTIADIGHFESEICAIDILFEILSKKIPTFALQKSMCSVNPIDSLI